MKLFYNTKLTNKLTTDLTNNGVISKTLANKRNRDITESLVDFQIITGNSLIFIVKISL